jgi:serine protease
MTVAVLDTGVTVTPIAAGLATLARPVASGQFVRGYDFVDDDPLPRRTPTGTARSSSSTIAERTGNGYALTGLAYGARIMPVRVLDAARRRRPDRHRAW